MSSLTGFPPLIMTYQELETVLMPLTIGYKWGRETIHDLWKIGAPTPDSTPAHEKRIIFPSKLASWLGDVLERQGRPLDDMATVYLQMLQESN